MIGDIDECRCYMLLGIDKIPFGSAIGRDLCPKRFLSPVFSTILLPVPGLDAPQQVSANKNK